MEKQNLMLLTGLGVLTHLNGRLKASVDANTVKGETKYGGAWFKVEEDNGTLVGKVANVLGAFAEPCTEKGAQKLAKRMVRAITPQLTEAPMKRAEIVNRELSLEFSEMSLDVVVTDNGDGVFYQIDFSNINGHFQATIECWRDFMRGYTYNTMTGNHDVRLRNSLPQTGKNAENYVKDLVVQIACRKYYS